MQTAGAFVGKKKKGSAGQNVAIFFFYMKMKRKKKKEKVEFKEFKDLSAYTVLYR